MKCPACKNPIPTGSRFCLHCGRPQMKNADEYAKAIASDMPPEVIDNVTLRLSEPMQNPWNLQMGRAFTVSFSVRDHFHCLTRADGDVELRLEPAAWWLYGRTFRYTISKEDFELRAAAITGQGEGETLAHEFCCPDPVLDATVDYCAIVSFKTAEGRVLPAARSVPLPHMRVVAPGPHEGPRVMVFAEPVPTRTA